VVTAIVEELQKSALKGGEKQALEQNLLAELRRNTFQTLRVRARLDPQLNGVYEITARAPSAQSAEVLTNLATQGLLDWDNQRSLTRLTRAQNSLQLQLQVLEGQIKSSATGSVDQQTFIAARATVLQSLGQVEVLVKASTGVLAPLAEAETLLSRLAIEADADPRQLEAAEERLFALRAAARKHATAVTELPALLAHLRSRLLALDSGSAELTVLETKAAAAREAFAAAAAALTTARQSAARRLQTAVTSELPPLRLDRARFVVDLQPLDEARWNAGGADAVRFLIATNPGQAPGALDKIASGGELSRLMLALKVVLVAGGSVPTLVFDEVDSGVGGATAAAVGERLARVAEAVQVLVVTHSPQVAARGAQHLQVAKRAARDRAETLVTPLDGPARREEIARMLAGERVTDAARAAADSLLGTVA